MTQIETPNLDAMDSEELHAFRSNAMSFGFPDEVGRLLGNYAGDRIWAMQHRIAGNLQDALRLERKMEKIYSTLPDQYRW